LAHNCYHPLVKSTYNPLREGLHAARLNLIPGLVLQAFALLLVLGYYFWPAFHLALAQLAEFKSEWGFAYSIVSTAIFGGLIPFLYLRFNPRTRTATPWKFLAFYLLFWAFRGFDVDLLYRIQALLFGSTPDAPTVIKKVVVDQFIYNPLWAAPLQILAYHWMDNHYSRRAFRDYSWREFFRRKIPTTMISVWGVWIPMVSIIYCLPSDLQIPLFNLVLCFWVLLLTALTKPKIVQEIEHGN